jgi:amidase
LDGRLNSYITVLGDRAIQQAKSAERAFSQGGQGSRGDATSPLQGIPIALKDLVYTEGIRTTAGSKVLEGFVPEYDATVTERLEAAGTVLLGKLNMSEFAMGGTFTNVHYGATRNPWDTERFAGSSSSGSGAAVAAGLALGALGTDTGGSIRFPAASCGVVGLKPTWGRVSRYGVLALAESLDHVGPLTRSTADAGIMLQAIAGHDPYDPTSLPDSVPEMLGELDLGVKGIRIGFDDEYATDGVDIELAQAVLAGVKAMEGLGAEIVKIKMPDVDSYLRAWRVLCQAEAVAAHSEHYPARKDEYGAWFRGWLDHGAEVSGADYARASYRRAECNGLIREVFREIDVLACPSTIGPPFPVTTETGYGPNHDRGPIEFQRYTAPYNYSGAPTLSVPCGLNGEGLPLSLQFVGKHLAEPLLCRIGHTFEQATDWHDLHPPA